jgi:hypothetical protein
MDYYEARRVAMRWTDGQYQRGNGVRKLARRRGELPERNEYRRGMTVKIAVPFAPEERECD